MYTHKRARVHSLLLSFRTFGLPVRQKKSLEKWSETSPGERESISVRNVIVWLHQRALLQPWKC